MLFTMYQKPTLFCLAGVLAVAGLFTSPVAAAQDVSGTAPLYGAEQQRVTPVPAAVTKGIQQLVRLVPELSARYVVLRGPVDGPGVSGIAVAFLETAGQAEEDAAGEAIFDGETGNLLNLWLKPTAAKPSNPFPESQARTKAVAFAAGLQSAGNSYHAEETFRDEAGMTDVRLVRKINNVVLDDAYDVFVSFDASGRLVGFRTFNGKMHEPVNRAALPSAQRVISVEQAEAVFAKSSPLEKVYLLPAQAQQAQGDQPVEARLVYLIRDGVVKRTHTGGAVDAASGKRLLNQAGEQPSAAAASQTVTLQGAGKNWPAQTAEQAAEVVRKLFRAEPGALPLSMYTEEWSDGREVRTFIWGHFREDAADAQKQYELGTFPEGTAPEQKKHLMLVTDAKTGEPVRFVQIDQTDASVIQDKERDVQVARETLELILPAGENQLLMRDLGEAEYRIIKADPLVDGIPVYREGQTSEEGMYTVIVDSRNGKIQEVQRNVPAHPVYPQAAKAISETEAAKRLLQKFPFVLTYIHQTNPESGEISWNLAYDLSYRQTRATCFCGPEPIVDETISVDAFSGEVAVKEQ